MKTITAQEAKALSEKNKMTIDEIWESITLMASKGYNYWGTEIRRFPEDQVAFFENLGYRVVRTTSSISINW